MNLSGLPKVDTEVGDKSIIQSTPLAGIGIVQGPTKRGKIGEAIFIGNELQWYRKMGGEYAAGESKFPTYCLRILRTGGKLWVIRAAHYTSPADKTTLVGVKGNATITVSSNNSVWTAEEVGDGYNGSTIVIVSASSGDATKKDITISLTDSDTPVVVKDVKRAMTAGEISDFNAKLKALGAGVVLTSIATQIENGTGTIASGAQVVSAIVAADYTGTLTGANGWFVADKIVDSFRIANIGLLDENVNDGLRTYCIARKDLRYYIPTPIGLTSTGIEAFRDGTSPYSVAAHDTYLGSLIAGDINITDPITDGTYDIPGLVDMFALRLQCDIKNAPWLLGAGPKRGRVASPNNGVPYNMASAALSADADRIFNKGVNFMVNDPDYGTMYVGGKSLLKNPNSMLSFENVADLVVVICRGLKPLVRFQLFDPNDPQMWSETYRRVRPFIQNLERNRAIRPGENKKWFWQGDQDAKRAEDATFNIQADLDAGKYRCRFVFVPIVATLYIGIEVVVTDSGSVSFVVTELTSI
jgi:hypothetical protein